MVKLNAKLIVAGADDHPEFLTQSHITSSVMLGITETDNKDLKCYKNVRDVDKVNKHLSNARLAAEATQDELLTTSENVKIHSQKE